MYILKTKKKTKTKKTQRQVQSFPKYPLLLFMYNLPYYYYPQTPGTYITIDEPSFFTLEFTLIKFNYVCEQIYNDIYLPL